MTTPPLLDNPTAIRDHLRVIAPEAERQQQSVWFLLCDDQSRGLLVSPIDDPPSAPTADDCEHCVSVFAQALAVEHSAGGLLLALVRSEPASVTEADRRWFHAMHSVCAAQEIRTLGVWLLTQRVERELVLDDML